MFLLRERERERNRMQYKVIYIKKREVGTWVDYELAYCLMSNEQRGDRVSNFSFFFFI